MFEQASCCVRDIVEVNELTMILVFVNNTLPVPKYWFQFVLGLCPTETKFKYKTPKTPNLLKNFGGKYHLLYKVQ